MEKGIGQKGKLWSEIREPWIDLSGEITSPSGRSKGKTTQPFVRRVTSEYNIKNPEALDNLKRLAGKTEGVWEYNKEKHGAVIGSIVKMVNVTMESKAIRTALEPN